MRSTNQKIVKAYFFIITVLFLFLLFNAKIFSQEQKSFGINLSGFVKTDIIYDSREVLALREGHFLLYPVEEKKDITGAILNDRPSFNILSIQTRLTGKITAPDVLGAKTSGVIEGAFFGNVEGDINGFRLRHAFVKLEWENSSLLAGQFWHPMFIVESFPDVVSFNTGAPFQPFSRNPQIRFTQKFGSLSIMAAAYTQRDFQSSGPQGNSSIYMRNAALPGFHVQTQLQFTGLLLGFGGDYKTLKPRTVTDKNYLTDETVSSYAGIAFGKINLGDFSIKLEGIYGQNLTDLLMLGGYAVYEKSAATGVEKYTCTKAYSVWSEIIYGKEIQFALFGGYTKNNGADKIVTTNYARGFNIDFIYRISPRIIVNSGKFRVAGEVEYTTAAYGTPDSKGKVLNSKEISNLRLLGAVYLFF
ncbi:MAG: hypothetical protein AB1432_06790 [Bacteroidota bacterium]